MDAPSEMSYKPPPEFEEIKKDPLINLNRLNRVLAYPVALWSDKTAIPSKNMSSACPKDCSGNGELCVKAEIDGRGVCVISTTRAMAHGLLDSLSFGFLNLNTLYGSLEHGILSLLWKQERGETI